IVPKKPATPAFRVMFNEITKRAVQEAFEHPKQIDANMVDAQQARRVLDRLVGYKVSPLLCRTIGGRLSAGRVQSVALRMVVEREREIEAFVKTEYWTIAANLSGNEPPAFDARLLKVGEQTVKTSGFDQDLKKSEILIGNDAQATDIVAEAQQQTFVVDEVTTKERKRNPVPPFITSKLQQEASRKLSFPVKRTMMIWQRFVASQMMPALFDQTTIDIKAGRFVFRATGSVQKFDGFLKVYQEGRDEKVADDEEAERTLPLVKAGETLALNKIDPEQHFTEPPP